MDWFKKFLKEYWLLVFLVIFFGWLFINLLSSHMLFPKDDGLYSGGSTWGDLAIHLSYISAFTERGIAAFQESPIFLGEKLSYHFISDLISAILVKTGVSLRLSLIIPSFLFLILLVVLIYFLVLKITKSKVGAFLAPLIFFFNGTIFGLYYFWQDFKKSTLGFWGFLTQMNKEYAHLGDYNIRFSNIIADYVLPQRQIILGMVMGVLAIYFLWTYWDSKNKKNLLTAGFIVAFLPLIHAHTFMTMVIAAGFLVLIQLLRNLRGFKKIISDWIYFALPLLIIALPQVLFVFPSGKSFFSFKFGWMKGTESFWWFWLKNLGVHSILFIVAFFFSKAKLKTFYLAFLGVFIISNFIIFQPHDYDNMKVMLWWFLLSVILLAGFFEHLIKSLSWKSYLVIIPVFILLISTGILSVYRESYVSWLMFSNQDVEIAEFIKENTSKDAIFLTSDKHNHLVPCLTGRRILMGYQGWLWTHGIEYQEREKDVKKMFEENEEAKKLFKKYKVDYIMIGPREKHDYTVDESFFNQNYLIIFQSDDTKIYKTTND